MKCLSKCLLGVAVMCLLMLLFSWFVMLLWNSLVPDLFHGPAITSYWQAVGLLVLSRILFGGFMRGGACGSGGWKNRRFKQRWEEKMAAMSPEEREKFRETMRGFGWNKGGWGGDCCKSGKDDDATPKA